MKCGWRKATAAYNRQKGSVYRAKAFGVKDADLKLGSVRRPDTKA